jgi:hypothetical protein
VAARVDAAAAVPRLSSRFSERIRLRHRGTWLALVAPIDATATRSILRLIRNWRAWLLVLSASTCAWACVQGQRATDTGDPGFPFGPSAVGVQPLAYVQDIKPIFDRDCLSCHGGREDAGHYSVRTYSDTIADQRAGDASSSVVVDCSPGGSMYRYFSGDAVTDATKVFRWMVVYNAQQNR